MSINESKILQTLVNLGFPETEAKIYLTLLELNEALPSTLSRKTGVKRGTTYTALEKLEKKGLLSHVKRSGRLFFKVVDPTQFIDRQINDQKKLESSLTELKNAIPEIQALYKNYTGAPQMSVFTGKAGLIQIMEDTLTTKTELLCWSNADLAVNTILSDYHPTYLKEKVKRKIWSKCLFLEDETAQKFKRQSQKELREVYFIPKDKFNFENEINVYDNKVSIISHKDMLGVIIENEAIAVTQRAIFNFAFEYAKQLNPSNE